MKKKSHHPSVEARASMWAQVPRTTRPTVPVEAAVAVAPKKRRGPLPGHGGGPRRAFTPEEIRIISRLARVGATRREVAGSLGIGVDTLHRRLADTPAVRIAFFKGRARVRLAVRRRQIAIAMDDTHPKQARMLIFLGKTLLGQTPPPKSTTIIKTEADALAVFKRLLPGLDVTALQRLT